MDHGTQSLRDVVDRYSNVSRFSKCLDVTRPTMYKYIDAYDSGRKDEVPEDVLKVFETVMCGNDDFRALYFNRLYSEYLNSKDRDSPVPQAIADQIDRLDITVADVDR